MSQRFTHLGTKCWKIYLPILFVVIFVVIFYHAFRWLFDYNLNWFSLEDYLWVFVFPMVFSAVMPYILLKRRIRLLRSNSTRYSVTHVLYYVIGIVCFILIMVTHKNIERLAFEIIEVPTVADLETYSNERFFDILDPSVNRREEAYAYTSRVTGKYNRDFTITVFLAFPFVEGEQQYWFGLSDKEKITNSWSQSKKRAALEQLKTRFYQEVHERRFDSEYGFRRLMPSDDREGYMKAIKRATNLTDAQYDVLEILVPEDIEAMEGIELSKTTFWVFGIGSLILMIMVLFSIVDTKKLGDSHRPVVYFKESRSWLRSIQWNFRNLPITTTIIGINLLVFLTGVYQGVHFFFPSGDELFRFGAATQDSLLSENYWQILSSFFVHAGLMHLLYNMVALFCVAAFIEQKLKSFLFVIVYLLSGVFAVLVTLYLGDNVILVGASGAVFGLLGIMLAFLLFNIFEKESRTLVMFCLIFFGGISLVIGFFTPNVANIAHLSGLAFGFAFGSMYALIAKLR